LLGIGAGTSAISKGVDSKQDSQVLVRHQDHPSEGFLTDILSDETGVSMHRFQALVFNIIYGVLFVHKFIYDSGTAHKLPEFNATELGLLGISAGTFLYMKNQENQPTASAATVAVGVTTVTDTAEDLVVG
jgi:hypothetical protein